jgi:hypothetical protein
MYPFSLLPFSYFLWDWRASSPLLFSLLICYRSIVSMKPFLHLQMSQSAIQKPSLKPQTASNTNVEAQWLGKTP